MKIHLPKKHLEASGWIFSPQTDLLVFSGPVLLTWVFIAFYALLGQGRLTHPPLWVVALFLLSVDLPHVYGTLYKTYLDPRERSDHRKLFTGAPLLCFAAALGLYSFSPFLFSKALIGFAMFHFMRQQYGWMAWATLKGKNEENWDRSLNKAAIYNATLLPLLWWFSQPIQLGWFSPGDVPTPLPSSFGPPLLILHWIINLLFLGRQITRLRRGQGLNLAVLQILMSTWLLWYLPIVILGHRGYFVLSAAGMVLSHGIPYFVLTYRYTSPEKTQASKPWSVMGKIGGFYGFLFLLGALEFGATRIPLSDWIHNWLSKGSFLWGVLIAILVVPQTTHYFLDGFIWRPRKDTRLQKRLHMGQGKAL